MRFVGEYPKINESSFCKFKSIGRRLYEYRPTTQKIKEFNPQEIDIPFPEKYLEDFTYTVGGFSFKVNGTNKRKEKLNPSSNLINFETNRTKHNFWNNDLKAYIEKLKQHFQQQQLQFLKEQKNYQEFPKKYKKVIYQEETESEPEFEEEEENEIESEQIEKKNNTKRKNRNIYDFINKKCREK